jgi:6-phosphogluconolactonase (cycloisomerase 2 family)
MKFSKSSQLFLVSLIGLLVAGLLTACQIVTIDYVFVAASAGNTSGSAGQIYTYATDSQSGALRTGAATVSSGGTSPVAMAVSSDYNNLYVANKGNNTVVHFSVSSDGVLTQVDSVTLSTTPVALTVNAASTYLYVVSGTSSATLTEYALSSGKIGSATATQPLSLSSNAGDTVIPTAVAVLPNSGAVYVTAYDQSAYNPSGSTTSSANPGWVFGYTVASGGALTATTGSPYESGTKPVAIVIDPTGSFVYAADYPNNELVGYVVQSTNALNFMVNGPFKTGNEPTALTIDPRGKYLYVANSLDSSVSSYTITMSTGAPSTVVSASSSTSTTDTLPMSIAVDPALGRYVYTANYVGNSISGFRLAADSGALSTTQATPYVTGAYPTAIVIVPHGNHAIQVVTR